MSWVAWVFVVVTVLLVLGQLERIARAQEARVSAERDAWAAVLKRSEAALHAAEQHAVLARARVERVVTDLEQKATMVSEKWMGRPQ